MEEHCGEFFERKRGKRRILLAYEVFIKPVSRYTDQLSLMGLLEGTYACSTWKHIRSSEASSSSGRFRMNRLKYRVSEILQMYE